MRRRIKDDREGRVLADSPGYKYPDDDDLCLPAIF